MKGKVMYMMISENERERMGKKDEEQRRVEAVNNIVA
jgi:hypothetical protein